MGRCETAGLGLEDFVAGWETQSSNLIAKASTYLQKHGCKLMQAYTADGGDGRAHEPDDSHDCLHEILILIALRKLKPGKKASQEGLRGHNSGVDHGSKLNRDGNVCTHCSQGDLTVCKWTCQADLWACAF